MNKQIDPLNEADEVKDITIIQLMMQNPKMSREEAEAIYEQTYGPYFLPRWFR